MSTHPNASPCTGRVFPFTRRTRGACPQLFSLALVLAAGAATAPCGAQSSSATSHSSPAASDAQRAEQLLEQGVELRRTNQDAEALALFRQALELEPESSRAQAHLGTTYQALGRWVLADTYLAQALAHSGDSYVERHREALQQALEFVKDHLGQLEVQGGPAGAVVLLNGQPFGTLPMREPARVPVGSYQMEVSLAGHYATSQPVRISRRALTREAVELLPLSAGARQANLAPGSAAAASTGAASVGRDESSVPRWLPWTLAGVSVGAAVVSTAAWIQRNNYADQWNDDSQCLNVAGQTREETCADEREQGEQAQTVALVSGGVAVAFGVAALWTALAGGDDSPAEAGLESCGIGLGGASCFGRF